MKEFLSYFKQSATKHKKALIILFIIWGLWFFGFGFIGGWLLHKGTIQKFPDVNSSTRLLVLAPHIDDETIGAGGLIQRTLKNGGNVKIIFMTNGDENIISAAMENKLKLSPDEFVSLGEQRMLEGKTATKHLGMKEENLVFLGFPDQGLKQLLSKNYSSSNPYTSIATKFDFSPYNGTYKSQQLYTGENVENDLSEIISSYKPSLIIAPSVNDAHPDHMATNEFAIRVLNGANLDIPLYTYLIHYKFYPPVKKLEYNSFIYPPQKLFTPDGWFSFDLTSDEEDKKLQAVNEFRSQNKFTNITDLLRSFVKRNEIFKEQ